MLIDVLYIYYRSKLAIYCRPKPLCITLLIRNLEARCLKRSILTETLANDLPVGTIRFGSHITALQMDPTTLQPILHLHDGRVIRAKVRKLFHYVPKSVIDY